MKKNRTLNTLSYILTNTPALIFIFLTVMGTFGAWLIFSKGNTPEPARIKVPATAIHQTTPVAIMGQKAQEIPELSDNKKVSQHSELPDDAANNRNVEKSLAKLSEDYKEHALKYTDALKIKVESKSADAPGYVAFMSRPEGFERGIPEVMEELADLYFDTFPEAPRITLSLVIGGGIKSQLTFLKDDNNRAVRAGMKKKHK